MTIPPEPRAVRWYFEHRLQADPTGYTPKQIAMNDLLWRMVCTQGIEGGHSVLESRERNQGTEPAGGYASAISDALEDATDGSECAANPKRRRAEYMRGYRAKKRAAQRPP